MPFAEYVASAERLVPGHVAGTPYTLILPSMQTVRHGRDQKKERQVSLSGAPETLYYYSKRTYECVTEPVAPDLQATLLEFLESVEDGQTFTFDPYGMPDARSAHCLVVVMLEESFSEDRAVQRGLGGADDYFEYSFGVREL